MQFVSAQSLTYVALASLIAWRVYARVRRMIARQRLSRYRAPVTLVVFSSLVLLVALPSLAHPARLAWLVLALACGVALGVFGLRRTTFEAIPNQGFFSTPSTSLGVALTLLFVARIAYRLFEVAVAPSVPRSGTEFARARSRCRCSGCSRATTSRTPPGWPLACARALGEAGARSGREGRLGAAGATGTQPPRVLSKVPSRARAADACVRRLTRPPLSIRTTMGSRFVLRSALLLIAFLLGGCANAPATAQASGLARIAQSQVLTVGFRETRGPSRSGAPTGAPAGYSIELCKRVAASLRAQLKLANLDVKWVPVTVATRMQAVTDGTVDLECGSTSRTLREKTVNFSNPIWVDLASFVSPASAPLRGLPELTAGGSAWCRARPPRPP